MGVGVQNMPKAKMSQKCTAYLQILSYVEISAVNSVRVNILRC